jgi:uroporphyrin-3 C-methyltransferase
MTEQEKPSAVVEETRETVDTTPQPETTENTPQKRGANKTSLALSAIAIAIALAAGVGLYGLVKQQTTNQTATNDALVSQVTALQKTQETQKTELEAVIKQQADALAAANNKQAELAKQLDEVQQKVATISVTAGDGMAQVAVSRRQVFNHAHGGGRFTDVRQRAVELL